MENRPDRIRGEDPSARESELAAGLSTQSDVQDAAALSRRVNALFEAIDSPVRTIMAEQEQQMAPLRAWVERMVAYAKLAHDKHRPVAEALLARGWCYSGQFTDPHVLVLDAFLGAGNEQGLEEFMIGFARGQVNRVLTDLHAELPPARAAILADAFEAHQAGQYTLSIPALLAQADGVGCEALGLTRQFFNQRNREKGYHRTVEQFRWPWDGRPYPINGADGYILAPLTLEWGLGLSTEKRPSSGSGGQLNRHGVLHGLDTDYPTEANSLRCVLLIGYLLDARRLLHKDIPRHLADLSATKQRRRPEKTAADDTTSGIVAGQS